MGSELSRLFNLEPLRVPIFHLFLFHGLSDLQTFLVFERKVMVCLCRLPRLERSIDREIYRSSLSSSHSDHERIDLPRQIDPTTQRYVFSQLQCVGLFQGQDLVVLAIVDTA